MALWGIFYTIIPLVLVGGLILAGAGLARKDEYDPRRTYVVYLLSTILVSLVVLVGGVTMLVGNIGERLISPYPNIGLEGFEGLEYRIEGSNDFGSEPVFVEEVYGSGEVVHSSGPVDAVYDRYNISEAIQAALVAGVAFLLLYLHVGKLIEITRADGFADSLLARTYNAYLYLVCFASVITAVIAAALALYALVRVAAPGSVGTFPDELEREVGILDLLRFGILAGLTTWIYKWHWKAAEALRPGATA